MNLSHLRTVCTRGWSRFRNHQGSALAAALAFYAILTAAPLLLVAIVVLGSVWGEDQARGELISVSHEILGERSVHFLDEWLRSAHAQRSVAAIASSLLVSFAAARSFVHLERSLLTLWDEPVYTPKPLAHSVLGYLWTRIAATLRLFSLGLLFAFGLGIHAMLTALGHTLDLGTFFFQVFRPLLTLTYSWLLFSWLFFTVPKRPLRGSIVWQGALLTACLFVLGLTPLSMYFDRSRVGEAYGAGGSLVVFLVWMYYSAQIVFLGAALTFEWSELRNAESIAERQ